MMKSQTAAGRRMTMMKSQKTAAAFEEGWRKICAEIPESSTWHSNVPRMRSPDMVGARPQLSENEEVIEPGLR